jgi:hypothetical protein
MRLWALPVTLTAKPFVARIWLLREILILTSDHLKLRSVPMLNCEYEPPMQRGTLSGIRRNVRNMTGHFLIPFGRRLRDQPSRTSLTLDQLRHRELLCLLKQRRFGSGDQSQLAC